MRVRDAMSTTVVTVSPLQSLRDAARVMTVRRTGAVIVLDEMLPGPGILTERDVMRAVADGADLDVATVQDRMTFEARTSGPDWDLQSAGAAMTDGHFRHLIVVDADGAIIGMMSMRDIVRARIQHDRTTELKGSVVPQVPVVAGTSSSAA